MNEAELLFTEVLNCDRASLYLDKDLSFGKDKSLFVSSVLKRRMSGEPIQYILGKAEFMGLTFKVDERVLIPRPETEILVETVLSLIADRGSCKSKILDIGTGSGCIAVSLAKLSSELEITATDVSAEALEVARSNARLNCLSGKIRFIQSDMFTEYEVRCAKYDVIVSNPPYIPSDEIDKLQPEVRCEPGLALDGGNDGLDFYRRIINEAPLYLNRGGLLIVEIGFGQRASLEKIIEKSGIFAIIDVVADYNNIDRVIVIKNGG